MRNRKPKRELFRLPYMPWGTMGMYAVTMHFLVTKERGTGALSLSRLSCLLAVIALPLPVCAQESLTIDLPSAKQHAAAVAAAEKRGSRSEPRGGRRLPSRKGTPRTSREEVVGRLGVVTYAVPIRRGRGSQYPVLAKVHPGTYVALTRAAGDWYGVMMSDRSVGWLPRASVQILQYEVLAPTQPAPTPGTLPGGSQQVLSGGQRSILQTAYAYLGVPYRFGGQSSSGIDCSAFVQRCFGTLGIRLPRTAHEQATCGIPIAVDQLQAADRLYFASRDGRISHTGIYIGNGYFIHASSSRGGVAISRLSERLYSRMYAGARR